MAMGGEEARQNPLQDEYGRVRPISLVSDEPADETFEIGLGMQTWADILAGVAVGTEGPFTVGLFAPWGQGKTSVLRRACQVAGFGDNVHTFVVNAWEHERHDDPLPPILEDILRSIDEQLLRDGDAEKRKRLNNLKRIISVLVLGAGAFALGAPTLALMAPATADAILQVGEAASKAGAAAKEFGDDVARLTTESEGRIAYGTGLRAYLQQAKSQYLPNDKVVVFVDDLDRCHPDKAVLLLESIKHLLWVPGFVFVLALDNVVLERYLQHRYEEQYGLKHDPDIGRRYLEKLVQLTIYLPESEKRFKEYVEQLLYIGENQWRLDESIIPILVAGAKTNPRHLKRRINDLIVDRIAFGALQAPKEEDESDKDAQICLAIHRLLRDVLTPAEIRRLMNDERMRNALTGDKLARRGGLDDAELARPSATEFEGPEERILNSLREKGVLDLFQGGGAGTVWITNNSLREATRTFLTESRPREPEAPIDQVDLVNNAIRAELGLGPNVPITDEIRKTVVRLDMEGFDLSDEGLRLFGQLTALQNLYLSGTQVSDLSPLSGLTTLQHLYLGGTQVSDLSPLSGLTTLQHLYLGGTQVSDLSPLSGLTTLQHLYLGSTQVSDLSPLSGLTTLQYLNFVDTQVSDLAPLSGLTSLKALLLGSTRVSDLSPLSGLTTLQYLYLGDTQVSDLSPLSGLTTLQHLYLGVTQVSDLSPLSGLTALQKLDLDNTQVSDLSPLTGLTALQKLDLDNTQVSDLSPLTGLTVLMELNLSGTRVSDLSPLTGLTALPELNLSNSKVSDVSPLTGLTALQFLRLSGTQVSDLSPLLDHPNLAVVYLPDGAPWKPRKGPPSRRYLPRNR